MKRQTRYVDVQAEVSIFEFTEEEREKLRDTAHRIMRICQLVPQEFDRKAVMDLARGVLDILEE